MPRDPPQEGGSRGASGYKRRIKIRMNCTRPW